MKYLFIELQGGLHLNNIAAMLAALHEATAFTAYIRQVKLNAKVLAHALLDKVYTLATGGTEITCCC